VIPRASAVLRGSPKHHFSALARFSLVPLSVCKSCNAPHRYKGTRGSSLLKPCRREHLPCRVAISPNTRCASAKPGHSVTAHRKYYSDWLKYQSARRRVPSKKVNLRRVRDALYSVLRSCKRVCDTKTDAAALPAEWIMLFCPPKRLMKTAH
jgi:hypothetical protein